MSHTIPYLTELVYAIVVQKASLPLRNHTYSLKKILHPPFSPRTILQQPLRFPPFHILQQPHPKHTMTIDMDWSPSFCLACDKQTESVYCSEACRLAEYEVASNVGSAASSPTSSRGSVSWPARQSNKGFYMEPAYNFSNAQPYGTTPSPRSSHFYQTSRPKSSPVTYSKPVLTPSSSQSSLFSMQSSTSSTSSEPTQLSDESRRALRAYASSFDQSRYSRRQSTN